MRQSLTATPKETEYVPNIAYFGDPVSSYSLRQSILDGFLAPYKVVNVHISTETWRATATPRRATAAETMPIRSRCQGSGTRPGTLLTSDNPCSRNLSRTQLQALRAGD